MKSISIFVTVKLQFYTSIAWYCVWKWLKKAIESHRYVAISRACISSQHTRVCHGLNLLSQLISKFCSHTPRGLEPAREHVMGSSQLTSLWARAGSWACRLVAARARPSEPSRTQPSFCTSLRKNRHTFRERRSLRSQCIFYMFLYSQALGMDIDIEYREQRKDDPLSPCTSLAARM